MMQIIFKSIFDITVLTALNGKIAIDKVNENISKLKCPE